MQWLALFVTIAILVVLAWQRPSWLVGILTLAVALEISILFYPPLGIINTILGGEISLTRLTVVALILTALIRVSLEVEYRERLLPLLTHPLALFLALYVVVGAISLTYSAARMSTLLELLRLGTYLALFCAIVVFTEKKQVLMPFVIVHAVCLLLLPLTAGEWLLDTQIWQGEELAGEPLLRINSTFVDPNIFARYLVLGVAANFILYIHSVNRVGKVLCLIALPLLIGQIAMTASRAGVLTLAVIIVLALVFLPNKKAPLFALGVSVLGGVIVALRSPEMTTRFVALFHNVEASNPVRSYLWKAGLAIWQDNPIFGTGLGTFQTVFLRDYVYLRTVSDGATKSHTTLLTIASELGIMGIIALLLLMGAMIRTLYLLYVDGHRGYMGMFNNYSNTYYVGMGYVLWLAAIFISSQSEGRLFEDPILWLAFAMMVVLGRQEPTGDRLRSLR
jgi:O-antigen ligase